MRAKRSHIYAGGHRYESLSEMTSKVSGLDRRMWFTPGGHMPLGVLDKALPEKEKPSRYPMNKATPDMTDARKRESPKYRFMKK